MARVLRKDEDWCRRGDSNPHGLPHTPLKRARLPVPPLRHEVSLEGPAIIAGKVFNQTARTTCSQPVMRLAPVAPALESGSASLPVHSLIAIPIVSRSGSANRARARLT